MQRTVQLNQLIHYLPFVASYEQQGDAGDLLYPRSPRLGEVHAILLYVLSIQELQLVLILFVQKLRVSTRRKKRLINNNSPLPSFPNTPASLRKSARKSSNSNVKMYSPFAIDTPGTRSTPRAIRMGIHHPKRYVQQ